MWKRDRGWKNKEWPAIQAVMKHAAFPAIRALRPQQEMSDHLFGAIAAGRTAITWKKRKKKPYRWKQEKVYCTNYITIMGRKKPSSYVRERRDKGLHRKLVVILGQHDKSFTFDFSFLMTFICICTFIWMNTYPCFNFHWKLIVICDLWKCALFYQKFKISKCIYKVQLITPSVKKKTKQNCNATEIFWFHNIFLHSHFSFQNQLVFLLLLLLFCFSVLLMMLELRRKLYPMRYITFLPCVGK